ncbi:MAG TPA: hypothetical protein VF641_04685 [Methylobacterium sp.]
MMEIPIRHGAATLRAALWLVASLALSPPVLARDRPGTPNQVSVESCSFPDRKPRVCLTFSNTASEEVTFEIEATLDGRPVDPSTLGKGCRLPATDLPGPARWSCEAGFGRATNFKTAELRYATRDGKPEGNPFTSSQGRLLGTTPPQGVSFSKVRANAQHCFRVRARRTDNDVVSLRWSNWACART